MKEGCKPPDDCQSLPDPPAVQQPPRRKLRPFPIVAIFSTFITVVLGGAVNFGLKTCLGLYPERPKQYILTPPAANPGPPVLHGAEVETKSAPDPRVRRFTIAAGGRKRDVSIKFPAGWNVLTVPGRPATEVLLMSNEGPEEDAAYIGLGAVDTKLSGTLDVWTMDPEDSVRRAGRNNPGKNPKLLGAGKLTLAGQHAIWMTTDYIEEGSDVCNKNYMICWNSMMITIGLKTGGPKRAATLAANERVFDETVKSFTFSAPEENE